MSERSARQVWETALGELQVEVSRPNFRTWLSGTVGLSFQGDDFVVGVPNAFVAEFLEKNMRSLVEKVLTGLARRSVKVSFCVGSHDDRPARSRKDRPLLNPRYTFDSFVVGQSNMMARAAAEKVAAEPGQTYNPLFIHGGAGLGKTHLLHAIGHSAQSRELDVLCVSAEQFTNELVRAIRESSTDDFRRKYRSVDVLLVDDVQFFGGKEQTKENFFHTFNALHASGRQIVVTSDSPPQSIPQFQERLRSRFQWGLVADLKPPGFDTRRAILEAKTERDGIKIAPDVVELIALQIKQNIRVLEGSLNRVVAYCQLMKGLVTPELAARALADIASMEVPPTPPTPAMITEAVATSFQVTLSDLKGRKRDEATARARHVSAYLMRQETECSLAEIGRELGNRSPATISHANSRIADNISHDPQLRRQVFNIQQTIHAAAGAGRA